jgi:hypothetical protein
VKGIETDGWIAVGLLTVIGILAATLGVWWLVVVCALGAGFALYNVGFARGVRCLADVQRERARGDDRSNTRHLRPVQETKR